MAFELRSAAFKDGAQIPKKHTADGPDQSPSLAWTDPPPGTESFALIADDPDAPVGTWVHWVMYNIPGSARELPEGVSPREKLPDGSLQGKNDFGRVGYGGPSPPPGPIHRYFFRLYALDAALTLGPKATRGEVEKAMAGHILAEATLMGRYKR